MCEYDEGALQKKSFGALCAIPNREELILRRLWQISFSRPQRATHLESF